MKFLALIAVVSAKSKGLIAQSSERAHSEVGELYKPKTSYGNLEYLRSLGLRREEDDASYDQNQIQLGASLDSMNEDELLVDLQSNLSSALASEARGDGDAAVAKTAAIKNIQKALTARILKRLDDGQPLVEVARKMKAIEGMQP